MGRRYTASLFAPATTAPIVYPRIKVSWLCHPDAYSVLLPDGAVLHLGREARVWIDLSRSYVTVAMIGPMAWSDYGPWLSDPDVRLGMELIGAAVKRRRRQNYLSQTKLGQMTGIPQSTISRFENGRRCGLSWARFARLVGVLEGLDFGPLARPYAPVGASGYAGPNPYLERKRLEAALVALMADDAARAAGVGSATEASVRVDPS